MIEQPHAGTLGGIGLESVQQKLIFFVPFLILLPSLNDMVGDFGAVVSTRFTTLLYTGEIDTRTWWRCEPLRRLLQKVMTVALAFAVYLAMAAAAISWISDFPLTVAFGLKLLACTVAATFVLVLLMFAVAVVGGIIIYKRKNDPDNFLIPLTTSIADVGSILVLTGVVRVLF